MRKEGHPEKDIEGMRSFFEELFPYVLDPTPAGQKAYDAFLDRFRDKPWYSGADSIALLETPLDDPAIVQWRNIQDVDSAKYWRRVRCPVFQTWGADEHLVNVTQSASRMAELVAAGGQKNFTSIVYPSPAGHGIGTANTPTYFDDLARWFRKEVETSN